MSWLLDGRRIDSVLVTRLRYLGDIVMSTVVLEVLKHGDPDLTIGYLCESEHAPALAGHPYLSRVHSLESSRRGSDAAARGLRGPSFPEGKGAWGMVRELRSVGYDLAVDLFFNPRSAWLLKLAGIPGRIGGTRKWRRRLYTHSGFREDMGVAPGALEGVASGGLGDHLSRLLPLVHGESGLAFAEWLIQNFDGGALKPSLAIPPLSRSQVHQLTAVGLSPERPFVVLAPGATWRSKEWPAEHWCDLAQRIVAQGFPLALLIPPGTGPRWATVSDTVTAVGGGVLPTQSLAGALALVGGAAGLISADGGVMHAAVGMGIPTVGIFGPTDPSIWFPYTGAGPFAVTLLAPACHPCDLLECNNFICLPDLPAQRVATDFARIMGMAGHGSGALHD